MTLLSKLFQRFPRLKEGVQKVPNAEKYVNPEGLVIPQNMAPFLVEVASELYRGIGTPDGQAEIAATLEFDQQQRISNVLNPLVNNAPKIPPFQTVEKISEMTSSKLKNAPANYKIKSMRITVKNGNVNTEPQYYA